MQFAVPQFTEVEDRLIGPLTLKQFMVLLVVGGIIMFLWSVLGLSLIFFLLALPIGMAGVGVALGRYNGRPMFSYVTPFLLFAFSPKAMVFKREAGAIRVSHSQLKPSASAQAKPEDLEPTESRLKKLAYLLDQKTAEQDEIIQNTKIK